MLMKKRGDLEFDTLIPWIVAILVLILIFVLYGIFSKKGTGAIEYFKQLWRFGR